MALKTKVDDSKINYQAKADELIALIKSRFITEGGFLSEKYPVTKKTLFDNFDDLAPFFLYFGEEQFLVNQVNRLRDKGLNLVNMCSQYNVLLTRRIDEWFGGLYGIWQKTGNTDVFALLKESADFVEKNLMDNDCLTAAYFPQTKKTANYQEMWASGLLEVFTEMRNEFPGHFEQSKRIMRNWCESEFFKNYSLFPYRIYSNKFLQLWQKYVLCRMNPNNQFKRPTAGVNVQAPGLKDYLKEGYIQFLQNGNYCQLMKSNSTCAFTLLELYRATEDPYWKNCLIKWMDSAIEAFSDEGCVYMEYFPAQGRRRIVSTTASFILVDVICDAVFYIEDVDKARYLDTVKLMLDHLWNTRKIDGLIGWDDQNKYAQIDNQVDCAVSMRRYYELTGNEEYRRRVEKLMKNTLEKFYTQEGYRSYYGKKKNNPIDPKYNALLLKGVINMMTLNQKLYPNLHDLFKDR